MSNDLTIEIDLNVLNHLGIGLYSSTPAVLTEIVANSWDADSTKVDIQIDVKSQVITIKDDGDGMSEEDIQKKFLTVGYARREHGESVTALGRQCMGRKGIGKLAMFSLAGEIHVISKVKGGGANGFIIDVEALRESIVNKKKYVTGRISDLAPYDVGEKGTLIVLKKLTKDANKTESFLRRRLARRFSVLGEKNKFKVFIGGSEVTISDRGFYDDIQLLWTFGFSEKFVGDLCKSKKKARHFDGKLPSGNIVSGFIGSVVKPEQLKKEGDNNNAISLMASGRVFEEDIQKRIDNSRVFNSYLVGELLVDYFDANELPDMAVSSRQGVQENDPRYEEFLAYIKTRMAEIATDWDKWRRELGSGDVVQEFPKLSEWYSSLSDRHRKKAEQLINKVNTMRFNGSEDEQKSQKREVIRAQILAFEKLKLQDNIDHIDSIDIEKNVAEFREAIVTVEDIEAVLHRQIVEQRLSVIRKLDSSQKNEVKEKVVQDHIYSHLWLVDTAWEFKQSETEYEKRLSEYLKKACPDTDEGARFDIGYRTTSGRYVVLELKKPGLTVSLEKIFSQCERYRFAMTQYFVDHPSGQEVNAADVPPIDIVVIVDHQPTIPAHQAEYIKNKFKNLGARITTYESLVTSATNAYQEYIDASAKVDKIKAILQEI